MESSGHRSGASLVVAEVLLGLSLVVAPLAIGTVQWWSLAMVGALAMASAVATAVARPCRVPATVWLALGVTGWVGLQAVPLPPALLRLVSPHAAALVEDTLGTLGFRALSLDPPATLRELARLLACTATLFAASRVVSDRTSTRRLTRVIAAMVVVEAVIVFAHAIFNTERIYGLVALTEASPILGSFGNGNHFAAYLTLGIPVLCATALESRSATTRVALFTAAAVVSSLVVLTASRSGIAGTLLTLVALWVIVGRRDGEGERAFRVGVGIAFVLPFLAGAALLLEGDRVRKVKTLMQPARLLDEVKVRAWADVPALIRDYWATGVGRGAFESLFPSYKRIPERLTFSHVENAPLQALADLGLVVGTVLLVGWAVSLVRAARREGAFLRGGATVALSAITLHELGDFSLEASGAVAITTAVLWGLALPAERSTASPRRWPRIAVTSLAAALFALALLLGYRGDLSRDVAAVAAARAPGENREVEPMIRSAIDRHPAEPWFPLIAGIDRVEHRKPVEALHYLNRALALDPGAWLPHQAIAEALWQLGRRSQALLEYRLAYTASGTSRSVATALLAHPGLHWDGGDGGDGGLATFAGDDPKALEALAFFLEQTQRDDDADRAARHLLDVRDGHPAAHRVLARLAHRRARFEELLAHAAHLPVDDGEAAILRMIAYQKLGRPQEAEEALARGFALRPLPMIGLALAEQRLARNAPGEALETLGRLAQEELSAADLGRLHLIRGRALEAQGKGRESILAIIEASRIDPTEGNRLALGSAYERAGLLRDALLVYRGLSRSSKAPSEAVKISLLRVETALGLVGGVGVRAAPVLPAGIEPGDESEP